MITGLLGKKIGMTQIFDEEGNRISVTVLEAGPCTVQAVKVAEKDGYNAVQLGYDDTKEARLNKPQRGYLKKKKLSPKKFVKEVRCTEKPELRVGDEITSSILQKGDYVDITGTSKGKGFQGGVKRHGWSGGRASHGSMFHRAPGSIGASSYPSRVVKGHGMPGQMGNEKVTTQNIEIIDVDSESHTVTVKGAVPGASGGYLIIRYAKKKELAPREEPEAKEEAKEQEQPAAEEPKAEQPKPEQPKAEKPEAEEQKAEQPKEEKPKAEEKREEKNDKKE